MKSGEKTSMNAMVAAILAAALISVGAWYTLNQMGFSSAQVYQKDSSVRLD
ncbi:MAG: hypothetical protein AAF899_18305 [Pseudomonadota bacterium]